MLYVVCDLLCGVNQSMSNSKCVLQTTLPSTDINGILVSQLQHV